MDETLRRLDAVLKGTPGETQSRDELVKLAEGKMKTGDVSGAILHLIQIVRQDASDESARGDLLAAIQRLVK